MVIKLLYCSLGLNVFKSNLMISKTKYSIVNVHSNQTMLLLRCNSAMLEKSKVEILIYHLMTW